MIHLSRCVTVWRNLLLAGLIGMVCSSGFADGAEVNLLTNGALQEGQGQSVPGWKFVQQGKGRVEYGVATSPKGSSQHLFIRKIDNEADKNSGWAQEVPAKPQETYRLQFQGRAVGGENHFVHAEVTFTSEAGTSVGERALKRMSYLNPKFPTASLADVPEWTAFSLDFTAPAGAAKMRIKFGLGGTSMAEAEFRAIRLTQMSVPLTEVLNSTPARIPIYKIDLKPVSAEGVALTPDWGLADAETWRSSKRQKICLNGLWAIQPEKERSASPLENDWAFIKVPGYIKRGPGLGRFAVYGQDQTSWAKRNIANDAQGVWYVRDIDVPSFDGRKVFLELGGLPGYSIRVYCNGQAVGTMSDQFGGRIDLTSSLRPGERGQLAIYALSTTSERRNAHMLATGAMVRNHNVGEISKTTTRGFHDLYLSLEPVAPVMDRIEVEPSVREQMLKVQVLRSSKLENVSFTVKVYDADGKVALDANAGKGIRNDRGIQLALPWKNPRFWNPDDPYLYSFQVQAFDSNGVLIDETLPERFGFREVWIEGKNLVLNGHRLHLRPRLTDNNTLDNTSIRRQIAFLKDQGFNCILRPSAGNTHEQESSHKESLDAFFRATDEMGMLIVAYTPFTLVTGGQFSAETIASSEMDSLVNYVDARQIRPLFNHPSVIAYSGFGHTMYMGGNSVSFRSDIFGISALDQPGLLKSLQFDAKSQENIFEKMKTSRAFIRAIKKLDPTRPFLSHMDNGEGDGSGLFDYFNWTPLQEWEDYPRAWSEKGVRPIGSSEHGLPYASSFLNHSPVNGDAEPWVTEYAAALLGDVAYAAESPRYLELIQSCYDKVKGNYLKGFRLDHHLGEAVVKTGASNAQAVWAMQNRAIYRSWRTYGVSMGIEPFGSCEQLIEASVLYREDGKVVADPALNLKTVGSKFDRWVNRDYWPTETMLSLPEKPTGEKPAGLTPLGETLHEVNSPLLAYIAGEARWLTGKDHVFWSGENINKQIAVVWDGFKPRNLVAEWKGTLNGQPFGSGTVRLSLSPGQISLTAFQCKAPAVTGRGEGMIDLQVKDEATGEQVASDQFTIQVYEPYRVSKTLKKRKIALFDPVGESSVLFSKLGLSVASLSKLDDLQKYELLVLGRGAFEHMDGTALHKLPPGLPILCLEQNDVSLARLGLRTYPIRARIVFPLPATNPVLAGVEPADLRNWRVTPRLLPGGIEALRDGYDYHNEYYGTVASVTIETPTKGSFTPLLQCGFDLRETPLLQADFSGRRIIFCQLSLVDGVGIDPVATRLASNLLEYVTSSRPAQKAPLSLVGDGTSASKWGAALGSKVLAASAPADLPRQGVALVTQLPEDPSTLSAWVSRGGTAVILPQPVKTYAKYFPQVDVVSSKLSLIPWKDLPEGKLLFGLGQNDFHYRQPLDQLIFNKKGNVAEIPNGSGRWILMGFAPDSLPIDAKPYLELTRRHQYRALSQIMTNLGVNLEAPVVTLFEVLEQPPVSIDIGAAGTIRMKETSVGPVGDWVHPDFSDASWEGFNLVAKQVPFAAASLRIHFPVSSVFPAKGLVADLGTFDDYDEVYLNGVRIGGTTPENSTPEKAWNVRRLYPIPDGLLKPGAQNLLAVQCWNRNAARNAWVRGPLIIRSSQELDRPYMGRYKLSDDPYLERHW